MKLSFLVFFYAAVICACSPQKGTSSDSNIKQGISGYVREVAGNQMPSPDRKPVEPKAVKTTVYVFELTNIKDIQRIGTSPFYKTIRTKMVKTIETNDKGYFTADLPTGNYSVFTKVDGNYYANSFDANNNINPVLVLANHMSEVNITISAKAAY